MNTRFSPSLNGSLHLGHLWMAWVNWAWAKAHGGRFFLRFDDLAPRFAGEDVSRMAEFAEEGQRRLAEAGVVPDEVTFLSAHGDVVAEYPARVGGRNWWVRAPDREGHRGIPCSPGLVAARVRADIREGIDIVIRGEDLVPEIQLYEFLNHQLGGETRQLVNLPRLRVRYAGVVETLSKTHGNLQLRDLYAEAPPSVWLDRVRAAGLRDPDAPLAWDNIHPDPVVTV